MEHRPSLYTIDPTFSFVDALVDGLLLRAGGDPARLSSMTILLPNRRAQRSLQEAFLRKLEHKTSLLPLMRPIGDVDEEELIFLGAGLGLDHSTMLPAISDVKRQVMLTRQVLAWGGFEKSLAPAQAWRLAAELARLMDQVETEGLAYDDLIELVPEELAGHWGITLEFLKIVTQAWPDILAAEGAQNPVARRDALLRSLAEVWREVPPKGEVIAAGSTGSIPATADLLKTVAFLPNGSVVLPGFDQDMSDEIWDAVDETHPQIAMKNLLDILGVNRHEVDDWPSGRIVSSQSRSAFLRAALLPSALTSGWPLSPYAAGGSELFDDCWAITAPTRREEADAIAVLMRETLESPGKTAALVTPDRQLARHVRASLARWSIDIDDSGGDRALNTVPGRFLGLIAEACSKNFAPVPLLAVLQHPLVSVGQDRATYLEMVRSLDKFVLRGVRPAGGLDGLRARAAQVAVDDRAAFGDTENTLLIKVLALIEPLVEVFTAEVSLAEILHAHIRTAEALAEAPEQSGADVIWHGEAGLALSDVLTDLIAETEMLTEISREAYGALFAELLAPAMVRPVWRRHPRLSIWGPLEARLQRADVMILGGLNEGIWPGDINSDPWMNRPMRREFGLPPLERRIGQSAHDFLQAASGGTVYFTRSEKSDGSPTVPSRWWFRLEALAGVAIPEAKQYLDWAHKLTEAERTAPTLPPAPKPPVEARPKKLSVTQVETWMRDPYGLYANKVLGLRTLEPIDDAPSASTKGTLLHEALERFLLEDGPRYEAEGLKRLIETGKRVFEPVLTQPTVYAFWWPRFEHIARWFVENEKRRAETYEVAAVERKAQAIVPGTDFKLVAKADRIDRRRDNGKLEVIDYKTGNVPTAKRVAAGFAPQLPLEAWLAEVGGFDRLTAAAVDQLIYWELKGGDPVQQQKKPVKDVAHTVETAIEGLQSLVHTFANVDTPYLSNPRPNEAGYGDYDHLARMKEWRGGSNPFESRSKGDADG
jgi:ATP-dependent helicase/nuclease subunit B